MFQPRQLVEAKTNEVGFKDAWFSATIIRVSSRRDNVVVEFNHFLRSEKKDETRKEIGSLRFDQIRPSPPEIIRKYGFSVGEEVEVWDRDCWWEGIVKGVVGGREGMGRRYVVGFGGGVGDHEYDEGVIRVRQVWKDGKWVVSEKCDPVKVIADNLMHFDHVQKKTKTALECVKAGNQMPVKGSNNMVPSCINKVQKRRTTKGGKLQNMKLIKRQRTVQQMTEAELKVTMLVVECKIRERELKVPTFGKASKSTVCSFHANKPVANANHSSEDKAYKVGEAVPKSSSTETVAATLSPSDAETVVIQEQPWRTPAFIEPMKDIDRIFKDLRERAEAAVTGQMSIATLMSKVKCVTCQKIIIEDDIRKHHLGTEGCGDKVDATLL